ncbi:MAG: MBL fold metallo-hydrolase [Sulfolobaceae archaeon]|nr:MBL fold metallo-hydrolase [Sulfolobaceae archaeon]
MSGFIKILGGGKEVGRSAIEVGNEESCVILDYGVNFDSKDNPNFPLQELPKKVKGFVATHSHLDHIGALPIYQISTDIQVYGTKITKDIGELILKDFLKLSGSKIPYEWVEVRKTLDHFRTINYNEELEIENFKLTLSNAGHIPGSGIAKVVVGDKVVAYTGDINTIETKLSPPADLGSLSDVNVLVMEATYGKFNHPPRPQVENEFYEAVREVVENGGTVLVPSFSLARSQEILSILMEKGFDYPVSYDGMVKEILEIMIKNKEFINRADLLAKVYDSYRYVKGWEDRHKVWKESGVIVASAGMLKGGPALYYLKKLYDNPKNAVFLVSYQGENTPGRKLIEEGRMESNAPYLKARLELFDFSSHAGKDQLLEIAKSAKSLEKLVIVHSSPDNAEFFASLAKEKLGVEVIVAENGMEIKL